MDEVVLPKRVERTSRATSWTRARFEAPVRASGVARGGACRGDEARSEREACGGGKTTVQRMDCVASDLVRRVWEGGFAETLRS